jgi:hypothetical protein
VERKAPYVHVRVPLPMTCAELVAQLARTREVTISHDDKACPLADGSADAHGLCWRIKISGKTKGTPMEPLNSALLSDHDVSSLIKARQLFVEGARYQLNIGFEQQPTGRTGVVFRECRTIARELGLRPVTPGTFLELKSEKLMLTLSRDGRAARITGRSSVTDEVVGSFALIPPEGKSSIPDVMKEFDENLEAFVQDYFDDGSTIRKRIAGLAEAKQKLRSLLRRIRDGLS